MLLDHFDHSLRTNLSCCIPRVYDHGQRTTLRENTRANTSKARSQAAGASPSWHRITWSEGWVAVSRIVRRAISGNPERCQGRWSVIDGSGSPLRGPGGTLRARRQMLILLRGASTQGSAGHDWNTGLAELPAVPLMRRLGAQRVPLSAPGPNERSSLVAGQASRGRVAGLFGCASYTGSGIDQGLRYSFVSSLSASASSRNCSFAGSKCSTRPTR